MDDDSSSLQSQDTDKLPDTPTSLAKINRDSKESTPVPVETNKSIDIPPIEKKEEIIVDTTETVSNEVDKKVIKKDKGKAPQPPIIVTPPVATASTKPQTIIEEKPTPIVPLVKETEEEIIEPKPKKEQAPVPPTPPVAPVVPVPVVTPVVTPVITKSDSDKSIVVDNKPEENEINVVIASTRTPTPPNENEIILDMANEDMNNKIISINDIPPPTSFASSTPSKFNTSTITINSNTPSKASENSNTITTVSQVTVVTSHPPVIIDNSVIISDPINEVVIVSNELNKTHVNESSTDDDYPSLDSLENSPKLLPSGKIIITDKQSKKEIRGRKLDESEVLIVTSNFVDEIEEETETDIDENDKDTSHVSVVTVGEENVKVRDSSNIKGLRNESTNDLSKIPESPEDEEIVGNGDIKLRSTQVKNDVDLIVNKKRTKPEKRISPDSSVGSLDSRTQSDTGSIRSTGLVNSNSNSNNNNNNNNANTNINNKIDRSDAESIATTTSHDSRDQNEDDVIVRRKVEQSIRSKEEIQLRNLRKKTRKRTRKFEIDGVQVTTTTSKVIYGDEESGKVYDDHIFRKQELRELKMLQKQEKKQFDELQFKEQAAREAQEKRFEQERITLERTYEADMDTLARQHRQLVEKTEQQQESDLRAASKRIRAEQERDLKHFRDSLKQELRLLKQEIDLLPKDKRKDEFKKKKATMEIEHEEKERTFLSQLSENHELSLRRLSEKHRDRLATIDRNFLQQKQTAMRTREAMLWELEEKQIHEKHQLSKRHVKELCFMQRHQMIIRHEKELEQVKRYVLNFFFYIFSFNFTIFYVLQNAST